MSEWCWVHCSPYYYLVSKPRCSAQNKISKSTEQTWPWTLSNTVYLTMQALNVERIESDSLWEPRTLPWLHEQWVLSAQGEIHNVYMEKVLLSLTIRSQGLHTACTIKRMKRHLLCVNCSSYPYVPCELLPTQWCMNYFLFQAQNEIFVEL